MNEVTESLSGAEVIADDFLICGFGTSKAEATANHDANLRSILDQARERGLKLNPEKVKLLTSARPSQGISYYQHA